MFSDIFTVSICFSSFCFFCLLSIFLLQWQFEFGPELLCFLLISLSWPFTFSHLLWRWAIFIETLSVIWCCLFRGSTYLYLTAGMTVVILSPGTESWDRGCEEPGEGGGAERKGRSVGGGWMAEMSNQRRTKLEQTYGKRVFLCDYGTCNRPFILVMLLSQCHMVKLTHFSLSLMWCQNNTRSS